LLLHFFYLNHFSERLIWQMNRRNKLSVCNNTVCVSPVTIPSCHSPLPATVRPLRSQRLNNARKPTYWNSITFHFRRRACKSRKPRSGEGTIRTDTEVCCLCGQVIRPESTPVWSETNEQTCGQQEL